MKISGSATKTPPKNIEESTFLGAGFSAPLGLPVMSNFLVKSKDMYFGDPVTYRQFDTVFKTIEELSIIKNYFKADLFNIEEILSIV